MRSGPALTICTVLAVAAAATGAAAQPEQRSYTGGRFHLVIGGHDEGYLSRVDSGSTATATGDHKDQIEILSWSWGETRAAGKVEHEWKVEEGESAPPAPGGTAKFGAVSGMHRDSGMASPRDSASGLPTGKRQHKPVALTKPLDRGAVRVKVKAPWAGCAVGARYPKLTLGGDGETYELSDAVVTSCGSLSGDADDRPTEEVAFNYSKIQVRGWDPATKKE